MRTLQQQFFYTIEANRVKGVSKRADRLNGKNTKSRVYSDGREKALRDTAKQFTNFIRSNYPEIKRIKDITPEHSQAFIDKNAANWTQRTTTEKISELRKLEHLAAKTYNIKINITEGLKGHAKTARDASRTRQMDPRDLEKIRQELSETRGAAKIAVELTARTGLRCREAAYLNADNIDIKNGVLKITEGAKGGKHRTIPIRSKDLDFFKELKASTEAGHYVCGGVQPASIQKGIRRAMDAAGISKKYAKTSEHAIRKLYARERMEEITGKSRRSDPRDDMKERDAWNRVQYELGYTANFRPELYNTYITN